MLNKVVLIAGVPEQQVRRSALVVIAFGGDGRSGNSSDGAGERSHWSGSGCQGRVHVPNFKRVSLHRALRNCAHVPEEQVRGANAIVVADSIDVPHARGCVPNGMSGGLSILVHGPDDQVTSI